MYPNHCSCSVFLMFAFVFLIMVTMYKYPYSCVFIIWYVCMENLIIVYSNHARLAVSSRVCVLIPLRNNRFLVQRVLFLFWAALPWCTPQNEFPASCSYIVHRRLPFLHMSCNSSLPLTVCRISCGSQGFAVWAQLLLRHHSYCPFQLWVFCITTIPSATT